MMRLACVVSFWISGRADLVSQASQEHYMNQFVKEEDDTLLQVQHFTRLQERLNLTLNDLEAAGDFQTAGGLDALGWLKKFFQRAAKQIRTKASGWAKKNAPGSDIFTDIVDMSEGLPLFSHISCSLSGVERIAKAVFGHVGKTMANFVEGCFGQTSTFITCLGGKVPFS